MREAVLIATAAMLAAGAWVYYSSQSGADEVTQEQDAGAGDGIAADILESAGQALENIGESMGILKLSAMRTVTAEDVAHPNVRALLAVIRRGEGTSGPDGYRTMFGGGLFSSYADHPRQRITRTMGGRPITSTAAGAFQFLSSTWDETARIMGLSDFTPASQDRAAVGRIAARGALEDAKAGRLSAALSKVAREWASMPGSPYGQPVITAATAAAVFSTAGGVVTA